MSVGGVSCVSIDTWVRFGCLASKVALRDSSPRPQPCGSDLGTRTGWFQTARHDLTRDDQDFSSDPAMTVDTSCGACCGARIRRRDGGIDWQCAQRHTMPEVISLANHGAVSCGSRLLFCSPCVTSWRVRICVAAPAGDYARLDESARRGCARRHRDACWSTVCAQVDRATSDAALHLCAEGLDALSERLAARPGKVGEYLAPAGSGQE
jgi:hypothetical protein